MDNSPCPNLAGGVFLWAMKKKERLQMISTRDFAAKMGVNYRTALNWLQAGKVPGAVEMRLANGITFWEIPHTATVVDKPKPGPKPGRKKRKGRIAD
jgi:hypothetical protein